MTDLYDLYNIADNNKIEVYHYPLYPLKSMSTYDAIGIDADQMETTTDEKECLAHELGHCMTGSFYNIHTLETRDRMEYRANRWAIRQVLPFDDLEKAFENGITEIWELAEYFEVSEEFIQKAVSLYEEKIIQIKESTYENLEVFR